MIFSSILYLIFITLVALILEPTFTNSSSYVRVLPGCSYNDFNPRSSYKSRIDTMLSFLISNASSSNNYGFYATNTTGIITGSASDAIIYGLFMCQGDISVNECHECVKLAASDLPPQKCPEDKAAVMYYDKCMVRYSNSSILGNVDESSNAFLFWRNEEGDIDTLSGVDPKDFMKLAGNTLHQLADNTTDGDLKELGCRKYYKTTNVRVNSYVTLYGMTQCTPDLAPADCARCLDLVIIEIPKWCNGSKGCRILHPSCYTRYEVYKFYIDGIVSPPPAQPSLGPPSQSLPPPVRHGWKSRPQAVNIFLGILVLLMVALVVILIYAQCRKRINDHGLLGNISVQNRTIMDAPNSHSVAEDLIAVESLQYDLETLKYATNNFSDDKKIGEGGYATVYKGLLPNGQEIAVKRLMNKDAIQSKQHFKAEAEFVAKLQHRNLARLLGYCLAADEKLLVFEFVPRLSLDLILFDHEKKKQLSWPIRYKIIQGIARGILYLHEDSRLKIVHRDLKASNILLDADMNPKISDFGLARNFLVNQENDITTRPAGTLSYMAPEYMDNGEFSTKSDVYSFGVLTLEIINGQKNNIRYIGTIHNLLTNAWKNWKDGTPLAFVDESLGDSFSITEFIRCMNLGLLCVQHDKEERPTMLSVVSYLNSYLDIPSPQHPALLVSTMVRSIPVVEEHPLNKSSKTGSTSMSTHSSSGIEPYIRSSDPTRSL